MTTTVFHGLYSGTGNAKLGHRVGVVNRLPGATCPGASEWCARECYAKRGQTRMKHPLYATRYIELPASLPALVRFHASGDFDTQEYIDWSIFVVREYRSTMFWAYTRSWTVPTLLPSLEILRAEPNMQLFASTDATMPDRPPAGWRIAYIQGDVRYTGIGMTCLEQTGKMRDCNSCTYCFRKPRGHVEFITH